MEDLRKNYNVTKDQKVTYIPDVYKRFFRKLIYLAIIAFVILYPELIGEYVGKWMDSLYTSFREYNTILVEDWHTTLITVFTLTIIYSILKWIRLRK